MASSVTVILGLLSIAALVPYDAQGITCNSDLQCTESGCNTTANNTQYCTACPDGFGLLYNPPNATKCSKCGTRCASCKVIGQVCSQCVPTYGPVLSGNNTGNCGPCVSEAYNCAGGCDVNGAGRCDKCDSGYGLTNGNRACSPCVSNCVSCDTNITYCDVCASSYYFYPNRTCGHCSAHCTQDYKCQNSGAEKCDRCDDGYGLTSTKTCAPCAANCTTYGCAVNGAGKCDRCDLGFNLTSANTCTRIIPTQKTTGVSAGGGSSRPSLATVRSVASGWTTAMTTWTIIPDQGISSFGGDIACPMLEVGLGLGVPCGFIIIVLLILIIVLSVQNRSLREYKKQSQDNMQIETIDSTISNAAPQPTSIQYQQLRMQDTQRDYERIEDKYDTISTADTEIRVISDTVSYVSRRATLLPSEAGTESTGHYETPIN